MDKVNERYWYTMWHLDTELHNNVCIDDVTPITKEEPVTIYGDTDSLFVSFAPAMDHCEWKNRYFNSNYMSDVEDPFVVLFGKKSMKINNTNCLGTANTIEEFAELLKKGPKRIFIDGLYVKDRGISKYISGLKIDWNWSEELDFIQGVDFYRYAGYFKDCLEEHADSYGVENKQDFELERISDSIINLAKKKYIQNIIFEDGIPYDNLSYIFPKGVELVRSSTPAFARDKIINIVKYLFSNPDTFNAKDLLKQVKSLRKEFDLCVPDRIDDICMQSSCSNYEEKVLNDKEKLEFVSGSHFAVKASAYYNHLLHKNKGIQDKYEFIKSGTKIKYYYCKDKSVNDIFAYIRGSYPIEMGPEIDLDEQFAKSILSPINSIIEPLGLPEITKRLSVVVDIFGGNWI